MGAKHDALAAKLRCGVGLLLLPMDGSLLDRWVRRLIQTDALRDTYDADGHAAVVAARRHLQVELEHMTAEHEHLLRSLEAYSGLGEPFQQVVDEYAAVQKEIDNRRWMLNRFGSSHVS